MNYPQYLAHFHDVLSGAMPQPPYDNPAYVNYVRLNQSRMTRWEANLELLPSVVATVKRIMAPQRWIVLVEPWCGDAAPTVPFLVRLADLNPLVAYDLQLRDQPPFLINEYLTNGGKSIPKLIVRDASGTDLFTWGPRPKPARQLVQALKATELPYEQRSIQVQKWYNEDKGRTLQAELLACFQGIKNQMENA